MLGFFVLLCFKLIFKLFFPIQAPFIRGEKTVRQISLKSVVLVNTGEYTCQAKNGALDENGDVIEVKQTINLFVKCKQIIFNNKWMAKSCEQNSQVENQLNIHCSCRLSHLHIQCVHVSHPLVKINQPKYSPHFSKIVYLNAVIASLSTECFYVISTTICFILFQLHLKSIRMLHLRQYTLLLETGNLLISHVHFTDTQCRQ